MSKGMPKILKRMASRLSQKQKQRYRWGKRMDSVKIVTGRGKWHIVIF